MAKLIISSLIVFLYCFSCHHLVSPFPEYQSLIPNGALVPFPCNPGEKWPGVGHELVPGIGSLNPFGKDFLANGRKYDRALCQKDSDGDGRTNGEELGDPECIWQPHHFIPTINDPTLLTHPGICEPLDSPQCSGKNEFLRTIDSCANLFQDKQLTEWCPTLRLPGVLKFTTRIDDTVQLKIPPGDTFYLCLEFTVPHDTDYHIIAWEPLIANPEIVHQITVFVCDSPDQETAIYQSQTYWKPAECPMLPKECYSSTIRWVSGMANRCYDDNTGVEMGRSSYHKAILQIRYKKPPSSDDNFTDSSGLKFYYTPCKRRYDVGTLQVGQIDIAIPPKLTKLTRVIGKTFQSSQCSWRMLAPHQNYNITSALVLMNKLGVHAKLALKKRNGRIITIIDQDVKFDTPKMQIWPNSQAIILEPGDNIEIECVYKSIDQDRWTYFGLNASDETCEASFEIHPRPQNRNALALESVGKFDICSMNETIVEGCSVMEFQGNLTNWENSTEGGLMTFCNDPELGYPAYSCSYSCYNYLTSKQLIGNPCMKGSTFHLAASYVISHIMEDIYRIRSQAERCRSLKKAPQMSAKDRLVAEAVAAALQLKVVDEISHFRNNNDSNINISDGELLSSTPSPAVGASGVVAPKSQNAPTFLNKNRLDLAITITLMIVILNLLAE